MYLLFCVWPPVAVLQLPEAAGGQSDQRLPVTYRLATVIPWHTKRILRPQCKIRAFHFRCVFYFSLSFSAIDCPWMTRPRNGLCRVGRIALLTQPICHYICHWSPTDAHISICIRCISRLSSISSYKIFTDRTCSSTCL